MAKITVTTLVLCAALLLLEIAPIRPSHVDQSGNNTNGNSTITETRQDFQRQVILQTQTSNLMASSVTYTLQNGQPFENPGSAERIGNNGALLLQDTHLIEALASFARERIPERVVHAKGAGAHGYFVTTTDFGRNHTMMDVFSEIGKKTDITVRFSTVAGESGSADTTRDHRGFAVKFRTNQGIWDLVMSNSPGFFIRDPALFPVLNHAHKRNPQTGLKDSNAFWDFLGTHPEAVQEYLRQFTDLGTPDGYRHMSGWAGHAFRWVRKDGQWVYVKLVAVTEQGERNFTASAATQMAGVDPDHDRHDLFQQIESGSFPSWKVFAQILTPSEAEAFRYNVLDLTKDWPRDLVPPHEVGRIVLNQNPKNFFAEIEQVAFSPGNKIYGWEPSADPVLQARFFSYPDAQRHRLGVNFHQIPVNCPINPVANFQRDGSGTHHGNQGSRPNYMSSFHSIHLAPEPYDSSNHTVWVGGAIRSLSKISEIDFEQPRHFWEGLDEKQKKILVRNVAESLSKVKICAVKSSVLGVFARVDPKLRHEIEKLLKTSL